MTTADRDSDVHREWLGLLQPVGLVVSPPALVKAGAIPEKSVVELQQRLLDVVERPGKRAGDDAVAFVPDIPRLLEHVLRWKRTDLLGPGCAAAVPESLTVALPDYGETLRPTFVALDPVETGKPLLLIHVLPRGTKLDDAPDDSGTGWHASPNAKFERLIRSTKVQTGILTNGEVVRLVHAPEHQTSGHLTFPVQAMCEVGGRPILAAFDMLLGENRVFSARDKTRLLDILAESRNYQNEVSNKLADQVLGALWDLLQGFQRADDIAKGGLLPVATAEDREHVYGGLLTALMRMVFLLYAEDQGNLLPGDEVWLDNYSVAGLHRRLRNDNALHPDTMDQRYGAWAALLALFRIVHHGGGRQNIRLPARKGQLFDPDAYPFLEGRPRNSTHDQHAKIEAPRISDGCLFRVLQGLLVLDGERLSYRALDVEQIGSVYEAMMGYYVERVAGHSLAVRFSRKGLPGFLFFDVDELLAVPAKDRAKWLKETTTCDVTGKSATALKDAATADEVLAALERRVSKRTPRVLPPRALVLQPGEERRRSGSHYTPRELTKPIVETTLRPVLEALGPKPTPHQILDLKVCDPAMGSGAFLVEACRHLAERLVEAWDHHKQTPVIPPDEDALLHAKRLIAQRCLYGVDKNPFAVNLAKLSLWLVTLARDHPFTFVDHALRHGDSLVGLTREQIVRFHWDVGAGKPMPLLAGLKVGTDTARARRTELEALGDEHEDAKRSKLAEADTALADGRLAGDLVVAAFFGAEKDAEREIRLAEFRAALDQVKDGKSGRERLHALVATLRRGQHPLPPFHWEVEFPEVFGRENAGFDAIVGNPPFLGGTNVSAQYGMPYFQWLVMNFPPSEHHCDLVAYFLRRAFALLAARGAFGLIATNTVAQGDTREGGLREILRAGGHIFSARRRKKWPGTAAVVVSLVHVDRGDGTGPAELDGVRTSRVSAYLVAGTQDDSPTRLSGNPYYSLGSKIYGQGFLFDDTDSSCTPLAVRDQLVAAHPDWASRMQPYIGGDEINTDPKQRHSRYAIYLSDVGTDAELKKWPELRAIVESRVKPERERLGSNPNNVPLRRRWWAYQAHRPELYSRIASRTRVIAISRVGQHGLFTFLPTGMVYSEQLVVIALDTYAAFAALQARPHDIWSRFFGSTLEDRLRYTPSDVFETFPFPVNWCSHPALEAAGKAYYDSRAALMVQRNEGLTKTYNRFHDPEEQSPDILRLRALHDAMDRAVLDAYGWTDIRPKCEFLLDYEIDEEEWGTKKKPYRYRWPDDVRDEVLGRLLELNRQRAEEERLRGAAAELTPLPSPAKVRRLSKAKQVAEDTPLFGPSKHQGDDR